MVGETEYRPSLGATNLRLRKGLVRVGCKSLVYVKLSDTAQQMQTWRRLCTIAGHGFFTCLVAFSSQTRRVMRPHGCTSTASPTEIKLDSIVGALQCWLSSTGSCVRRAGTLRPLLHLVVARTYCSFGCGLVSRLVDHMFSLIALGSPMPTLDVGPQLLTSGTKSVYLMKGNLECMLSTRTRWILSPPVVYVIYFELVTLL
jgi:hypothetical protein